MNNLSFKTPENDSNTKTTYKKSDTTIASLLKTESLDEADYVLLGYPDDDGIKYNGGTIGAKEAPQIIRKHFFKMTPTELMKSKKIHDLGDLNFNESDDLESRHEFAAKKVTDSLKASKKVLSFGGGHDYGFADGLGFANSLEEEEDV